MNRYIKYFLLLLCVASQNRNLHAQKAVSIEALQDFISADSGDRWYARKDLFENLDNTQLQRLKQHCDDTVAVESAFWILSISKKEVISKEDGETISRYRNKDIGRFVGFLEGRLRTNILKEWEVGLSRSILTDFDDVDWSSDSYERKPLLGLFKKQSECLRSLKGQSLIHEKDKTFLVKDKYRVPIKKEFLEDKSFEGTTNVYGAIHADYCIVLFVSDFSTCGYTIANLDLESGDVHWKNTVWATGCGVGGPPPTHLAVPVIDGSRVFIYGADLGLYIECFSIKDGTPLLRLNTQY